MAIEFLPQQEIAPRIGDGCDWGNKRRMVARTANGGVQLFIRGGHSASSGAYGFGSTYHATALILFTRRGDGYGGSTWLAEGRISNGSLDRAQDKINKAFGYDITRRLDTRRTAVVG